jgi:N4-(beta-N-acetylglucosaminyl)-L-asparaginase
MPEITRRLFVQRGFWMSAGALVAQRLNPFAAAGGPGRPSWSRRAGTTPMIITSHPNETGRQAMETAWEILSSGGSALDAVEQATIHIEKDPEDTSVGYGGLPNESGVVQLDASIMDGKTYSAGSVSSLENIMHPASVARLVMERTDHVMLVGPGALEFAKSWGFPEEDLLTEKARESWLRWRENHSDRDDYGPPDHLKGDEKRGASLLADWAETYGTVNVLAVDVNGDIAGITSTSGLSWKVPGRIGDSPIVGAGLYVDNEIGAAGATGRGEDVIKACSSFYIVSRMGAGRSPQEACEDALHYIAERYHAVGLDFLPSEKFVAINRDGEVGCAKTSGDDPPRMTVADGSGIDIYSGVNVFEREG